MNIHVVGIDLGKTVFHLVGMDAEGNITLRKRMSRSQVLAYLVNVPACTVAMEASQVFSGHGAMGMGASGARRQTDVHGLFSVLFVLSRMSQMSYREHENAKKVQK